MRLAGITLAPSPRHGSVSASAAEAARKPRVLRRVRCSATAAFVGSGDVGDAGELSRATLLWRAAKLPIYSVALVPLTVGSASAYHHVDTRADKNKKESVLIQILLIMLCLTILRGQACLGRLLMWNS